MYYMCYVFPTLGGYLCEHVVKTIIKSEQYDFALNFINPNVFLKDN